MDGGLLELGCLGSHNSYGGAIYSYLHMVDTRFHVMLWQQCHIMTCSYCNFLANCSGGKVWWGKWSSWTQYVTLQKCCRANESMQIVPSLETSKNSLLFQRKIQFKLWQKKEWIWNSQITDHLLLLLLLLLRGILITDTRYQWEDEYLYPSTH